MTERRALVALVLAGIAVRLLYVLLTRDHTLAGDEADYDSMARFAADGHFLWGTSPYGIPHATFWKAPGYAAWLGVLYAVLGKDPDAALVVQAVVLAPLTIGLTWLLGRRLFTPAVGLAAAGVVALYPNAWQFEVRLFPEAIATPLTLGLLVVVLGAREASLRRAALVGVGLGLLLLVRPSSLFLIPPIAVMWWGRGGAARVALALVAAVVVIVPWSLRNHHVDPEHFVPISAQSAALYGVFNDDAANDEHAPWAWRYRTARDADLFARPHSDGEIYATLNRRSIDYIKAHPSSVPKAFFYNGVLRLWDLRSPRTVLAEVEPQGRTRSVAAIGLAMYWPLLALALGGVAGLWRAGRRRLVLAIAALVLATSVVYTADAFTRYRAPLEPLIAVLAMSAVVPFVQRVRAR
jgi:4-amino-4-deoxy-L-arabinose transferase-like glycosyltransferase